VNKSSFSLRLAALGSFLGLAVASFVPMPAAAVYSSSVSGANTTLTFSYTGSIETFTVPDNVSEITINVAGGEGGQGGNDSPGRPPREGYKGVVSGTVPVSAGQVISVAVGARGVKPDITTGTGGSASTSGDTRVADGGTNPISDKYAGGSGGSPGPNGSSGYGGSGGAATVVMVGTGADPDANGTIVAGGAGGSGGSGNGTALRGQIGKDSFLARAGDGTLTNGESGLYAKAACLSEGNTGNCDGGGGAAGGGGATGGSRGILEYGAAGVSEWFGHGGYPGANATADYPGLAASYNAYTFATDDGQINGFVTITYSAGTPGSPTGVAGTVGNGQIDLYWSAPASVGVSAISDYEVEYAVSPYSTWTQDTACTGTGTTCNVDGLVNGTAYKFRVRAENTAGLGSYSAVSAAITPSGVPAAPTLDSITPSDGSLSVAFTAGSTVAPIVNYEYTIGESGVWYSAGVSSSPLTIAGLANGTAYAIKIRSLNSVGSSVASNSVSGTPSVVPGAPTITSLTAPSAGVLEVAFSPGYIGGSAITNYEYATSAGENTSAFGSYTSVGSTASPFSISGLESGAAYTVALRAINSAGTGPSSAYQSGVTLDAPDAPTIASVSGGDGRIAVTYTAYDISSNGGSALSGLEYSLDAGSTWVSAGTLATTFTILGLTNGVTYAVILRATNAIGTSSSSSSQSVTPASVSSSPRLVTADRGQAKSTISWSAPSATGGSAITGYTANVYTVSTDGTAFATCTTTNLTCEITGLANGTTYYVGVIAANGIGNSIESSPRVTTVPAAAPGAPTISSVAVGNQYLSVAFSAGSADANAPITGYQYSLDNGVNWLNSSAKASPLLITGLTNGTSYIVKIRAQSDIGVGAASNSSTQTPISRPDAVDPDTINYVAGSGSVQVSWTAPNANGAAITSTVATAFSTEIGGTSRGTCTATAPATTCTISGLSNGVTSYVSLQVQNSQGYSPRSDPRVAVQPGSASTTTLTLSTTSALTGASLSLTAAVTAGATGTVDFTTDGVSISGCSAVAVASNQAVCTTTALSAKTHAIRANYSGDGTFASSASASQSLAILSTFTITYNANGGSVGTATATYTPGGSVLVLPTPTRTSYSLDGWYSSSSLATKIGNAGGNYTPSDSRTVYAKWVQTSLFGMGANTKIGSITTSDGVSNSYSASSGGSTVQVSYLANALPANTVIDIYLLSDTTRAASLVPGDKSFVLNIVTAWLAADGSVPDTAAGKPITVTLTNSSIKAGARLYALLGETVTDLGVATVDGTATVEITEDPEIVVVVTKPDAPTGVSATTTTNSATITWSSPAVSGGAAVTAYVATASTGQTCSSSGTTCTITGLSASTSYTFTVRATNSIGTSVASSASAAVSTTGAVGGGGGGGSAEAAADPVEKDLEKAKGASNREFKPVAPSRPVKETGAIATEDGNGPQPVVVRNKSDDKVVAKGTGWELTIGAAKKDGTPKPLDSDYAISTRDGEKAVTSGSGLAPNTWVDLYVFSDPVFVGTVETDSSGSFNAEFDIPAGLTFGAHSLVLGTKNLAGETVTVTIQINVLAKVKVLPSSIVFAEGSAALTKAAKSKLLNFIAKQEDRKVLKITIAGFGQKDSNGRYTDDLAVERGEVLAAFFRDNGIDVRFVITDQGMSSYSGAKARKVTINSFWRKFTS
jgi:outer membrane protein OmpA-like peptidoglycan-associated protein